MNITTAARATDPLWLLARQLQLGEFDAGNYGSPVKVDVAYETAQLIQYTPGVAGTSTAYSGDRPLESIVEPESLDGDLWTSTSLGRHFTRLLASSLRDPELTTVRNYYHDNFGVSPASDPDDPVTIRFLKVVSPAFIDGLALYLSVQPTAKSAPPKLPANQIQDLTNLKISQQSIDQVAQAAAGLVDIFESVYRVSQQTNSPAWKTERMEYQFQVTTGSPNTGISLTAPDYRGGGLDWHSFDAGNPTAQAAPISTTQQLSAMPAHVQIRGLPNRRWWEFEDAKLDVGSVDFDRVDLPKMLLTNMIMLQANNWFTVPIPLNNGSLTKINSVTVTDDFGNSTPIQSANKSPLDPAKPWRMFHLSGQDPNLANNPWSESLFLPPSAAQIMEGPILENVTFLRDEMADMAWGVEDTIQDRAGYAVPGYTGTPAQSSSTPGNTAKNPRFLLMTNVPRNWIPFLATQQGQGSSLSFEEASLPVLHGSGKPIPVMPRGKILQPNGNNQYFVRDEEIPREGTLVNRRFRRTTWSDGSRYLWIGRQRSIGKGEGLSGLRFDAIVNES